ncbi:MAG: response regulator [Candidatus Anammoxibacter sp.]
MKKKILLVEDNPDNRYVVLRLLKQLEVEVVVAEDGLSAIEIARKEIPDLILMDMQLPELSGYDVTKKIREMKGMESIPIIAVTAHCMVGDKEKAIQAGCTDFIEKPIVPNEFVQKIKTYLTIDKGKR